MRISTAMMYDLSVASMQNSLARQAKLQNQVASGQRIVTPSDDPIASAAALEVKQSQALNNQYKANGDSAKIQLGLEELALADVTRLLQDVKTLAVYGGNASLANSDRAMIALELESRYQELIGIANRADGNGHYVFAGYQSASRPFAETGPGNVAYVGDAGQRTAQIGSTRSIAVSDSGETVFRSVRDGNGTFVTARTAGNAGDASIDSGVVTDLSKWDVTGNSKDFTIRFHVDSGVNPPVTTYDIVDNVNNVSLLTGAAPAGGPYARTYVPGAAISLARQTPPDTNPTAFDFGAIMTVAGTPANGDTFTVNASANRDIFSILHGLAATLRTGMNTSAASKGAYQTSLGAAMTSIDQALNSILTARADVGTRLKEIDTAQNASEDLDLQYASALSTLQDLDFAKALTDLNLQQVYLQAAQKSFLTITANDLFDLM